MLRLATLLSATTVLCAPLAVAQSSGEQLYSESCQNCHGPEKVGLSGYAEDFAGFANRLNGETEDMPDFAGFFEDEEVAALYEYLTTTDD